MLKICLVGKPNVGKSTLFNRLVGKKIAIVDDQPGVTRDRNIAVASFGHLKFEITDTAGFLYPKTDLEKLTIEQMNIAIKSSDLVLFAIDPDSGVTEVDRDFASKIRKFGKNVKIIINKADKRIWRNAAAEAFKLGFGDPIGVSAEHNLGLQGIYEVIAELSPEQTEEPEDSKQMRISIVGKPNAGKSTLLNSLLGHNRSIASEIAGTTRDTVTVACKYAGKEFILEDTAGLKKKSAIHEKLDRQSTSHALRSVKFANTVIVLLDASRDIDKQDLTIADFVIEHGRAVVIAVNKWDLVKDKPEKVKEIEWKIEQSLTQARGFPIIFVSAKDSKNLDKVINNCFEVWDMLQTEISTAKLNNWLKQALEKNPPPIVNGRRIKLKYLTQTKSKPPKFRVFSNQTKVPDSYTRYLVNSLKDSFGLEKIPVRLIYRKTNNPYEEKS